MTRQEQQATAGLLHGDSGERARTGLANHGLQIAKVEPFCMQWPGVQLWWIVVRVETEEGLVGFGEATGSLLSPIARAIETMGENLIGSSAWDIARLWGESGSYTRGSVPQTAKSALDIAFWDLIGKKLDLPVYALLGGKLNERIPTYHHPWGGVEDFYSATKQLVAEGIMAGKLDPFPRSRSRNKGLTSQELAEAVGIVRDIREAGGPHFTLCVEMHGRFNVATAIRVAEAMRPFDPLFIEEPVGADDPGAMREVQRATHLAVATGERLFHTTEFVPLLEQRACRIIQPDVAHIGGITGLKKVSQMAEDYYVTVSPHCCWGPVHAIASAHVMSTVPNLLIQEDVQLWTDIYEETLVGGYTFDPQYLDVPEAPGLGIHIPAEAIQEYAFDPEWWDTTASRLRSAYMSGEKRGVKVRKNQSIRGGGPPYGHPLS